MINLDEIAIPISLRSGHPSSNFLSRRASGAGEGAPQLEDLGGQYNRELFVVSVIGIQSSAREPTRHCEEIPVAQFFAANSENRDFPTGDCKLGNG